MSQEAQLEAVEAQAEPDKQEQEREAAAEAAIEQSLEKLVDEDEAAGGAAPDDEGAEGQDGEGTPDSGKADDTPSYTKAQLTAARNYGLDLEVLGDKAEDVLAKLAKADSDIGRRWGEIGLAEKKQKDRGKEVGKEDKPELPGLEFPFGSAEFDHTEEPHFKALVERINVLTERLGQLDGRVGGAEGFMSESREAEATRSADRFFEPLAKEHPELGEGPTESLDEHSSEYELRCSIMEHAAALRQGFQADGKELSPDEAMEWAARSHLSESKVRKERDKLKKDVAKRSKSLTHRPSQRQGAVDRRSAEEIAEEKVKEAGKKLGLYDKK